ncbi:MAG: hypothetical protein II974_00985 [Firmicutes bacterium]|nr:hypothetical protein [Bacillota bacterium]
MNGFTYDDRSIEIKARDFLKSKGMILDEDPACAAVRIAGEMKESVLSGAPHFAMLRSHIIPRLEGLYEGAVLAVDIGGSHTRFAKAVPGPAITFEKMRTIPTPGLEHPVTVDGFFDEIAKFCALYDCERAGVSFSFMAHIGPDLDAEIVDFSKELAISGAPGRMVARGVNDALTRLGRSPMDIAVINDSCAAFLGCEEGGRLPDVSFILGTGYNNCYCEPALDGMLMNTESGAYGGIPQGEIDLEADMTSAHRGLFAAEKMVSGGYLGVLIYTAAKSAAREGLFSSEYAERLKGCPPFTTRQISEFLEQEKTHPSPKEDPQTDAIAPEEGPDRLLFKSICLLLIERAADVSAILTAACAIRNRQSEGKNAPDRPVIIAAEGSTYFGMPALREHFDHTLADIIKKTLGTGCVVTSSKAAVLKGTALAAMMKR